MTVQSGFNRETTALDVVACCDLTGKVALVTGASSGIGIETARALATVGAETILAVRDTTKGELVAHELRASTGNARISVLPLELGAFASIRNAAGQFAQRWNKLDILVNNAGVMATPFEHTAEGFEYQFGTNHVGHFLLTTLLLPQLLAAGKARVVSLTSVAHQWSDIVWDDVQFERRPYDPWLAYGQSKTANALFAVELTRRYAAQGLTSNAVHPGAVRTNLSRYVTPQHRNESSIASVPTAYFYKTLEQGAATSVWAAVGPELDGMGGLYLADVNEAVALPSSESRAGQSLVPEAYAPFARSVESAERLWGLTEELIAEHPAVFA